MSAATGRKGAASCRSASRKRRCAKCGETKPLSQFHKNRYSKGGHHAYCKQCRSVKS